MHEFPTKETTYIGGVIISIFQIKKLSCKGLHRLHLKHEYATLLKLCTVMKTYFLKLRWKIAFLWLKTNVLKCCSASTTKYSICHIAIPQKWSLSLSLIIFKKLQTNHKYWIIIRVKKDFFILKYYQECSNEFLDSNKKPIKGQVRVLFFPFHNFTGHLYEHCKLIKFPGL